MYSLRGNALSAKSVLGGRVALTPISGSTNQEWDSQSMFHNQIHKWSQLHNQCTNIMTYASQLPNNSLSVMNQLWFHRAIFVEKKTANAILGCGKTVKFDIGSFCVVGTE